MKRSSHAVPGWLRWCTSRCAAGAVLAVGLAAPAASQAGAELETGSERALEYRLGARASFNSVVSSSSSFASSYGEDLASGGFELEVRRGRGFLLVAADRGSTSGRQTVEVPRRFGGGTETVSTASEFGATQVHLGVGWRLERPRWSPFAAAGLSFLEWRESNDLRVLEDSTDGYHLMAGIGWPWKHWQLSSAVRWTRYSDRAEDTSGISAAFASSELSFATLELAARFVVGSAPKTSAQLGSRTRDRWAATAGGAFVHPTYRHRRHVGGAQLSSEQADGAGSAVALRARLGSIFSVGLEVFGADLDTSSTLTSETSQGTVVRSASGSLEVDGTVLTLGLTVLRRSRWRLEAGTVLAYLSYVGREDGDYSIGIDRNGTNGGLWFGAERSIGDLWMVRASTAHLSLVRIDGFESGFEIDPIVFTFGGGVRF